MSSRFLVLYAFPRGPEDGEPSEDEPESAGARLGVSVGRRVGGAVVRNRVKRMLREAFWAVTAQLPSGHDFVIVARADAAGLAERDGTGGFERELRDLAGKLATGGRGDGDAAPA